jgi:APA family basic amino acid/polyamine antiporter
MTSTVTESESGRQRHQGELQRILGVTFGIAVTIGGMIGVGILRTPGTVAAQLGSFWGIIAVWLVGGIYSLCGTLCVSELATSLPRAGGWYVYARRAFGDYVGFAVGWCDWLSGAAALAFTITTIGEYGAKLLPDVLTNTRLSGIVLIVPLLLLNLAGLRSGSRFQEWTSFLKAVAFLVLVLAIFRSGRALQSDATTAASPVSVAALFAAVMFALQAVIYTYDGWYSAIYCAEENRDPGRNLPRGMIGGVVAVTAVYLLVNLAFLYALPMSRLASSTLPAADAAREVFGGRTDQLVTTLALLSLPSMANVQMLTSPRILFAMSRDGLLLASMAKVNRGGTPSVALMVHTLAAVMFVVTGTYERLLAITTFLFVLVYGSGFLAILVLRRTEPLLPRPYRVWAYPWTPLVVLCGSFSFLVGVVLNDIANSAYAMALILCSAPLFLVITTSRRRSVS